LALAATFLTKSFNLPFLAIAALAVTFQLARMARAGGTLRPALPSLLALVLCAGIPTAAWLLWMKSNFGDFTGGHVKMAWEGWTLKPFGEWWRHPIFTPSGLWTYIEGLLSTFWQGEMVWHGLRLAIPSVGLIYSLLSISLIGVAMAGVLSPASRLTPLQRGGLGWSLACLLAGVVFLGFLSIIYDFRGSSYPSREHPYFSSGRLILAAAVPFSLLFVHGLDSALSRVKNATVRPLTLGALLVFMLVAEIAANRPVFASQFNWFHL
jgi:hypothetical protein